MFFGKYVSSACVYEPYWCIYIWIIGELRYFSINVHFSSWKLSILYNFINYPKGVFANYRFICQSDLVGYSSKSFTTTRAAGLHRVILRLRNQHNYREPCTILFTAHAVIVFIITRGRSISKKIYKTENVRSVFITARNTIWIFLRWTFTRNRITTIFCRHRRRYRRTIINYRLAANEWPTCSAHAAFPRFIRSCAVSAWAKYITRICVYSSPRKPCSLYVDIMWFEFGTADKNMGPN